MPEGEFREEIAELRTDHRLLAARVDSLGASVDGLREDQNAKHKENRRAIHDLRNNDQSMLDLLHKIDLKMARSGGYWAGIGGLGAFLATLAATLLEHLWR